MKISLFNPTPRDEKISEELAGRIHAVVDSGRYILGPEVEAFEDEFARYLGVAHVVGVGNGTDALMIALRAAGVGLGDEVVVPSFTFYATAESVAAIGAVPVFCDVQEDTYCTGADQIEKVLTERTKAVVPVHLFGNVAPMGEITELAQTRGLAVIEDAAQAAGASLEGSRAGSLGDLATFSFFPSKNLYCFGDGGAIATDSDELADLARTLRFHGSKDKKVHTHVGYNSRLDELQAAVLRRQLLELDGWNDERRRVASAYNELGLSDASKPQQPTEGAEHVYHLFVVAGTDRDRLAEHLAQRGIEARPYYVQPIHRQPAMQQFALGCDLPVTDRLAAANLALPMGPGMSESAVKAVVSAVADLDRSH